MHDWDYVTSNKDCCYFPQCGSNGVQVLHPLTLDDIPGLAGGSRFHMCGRVRLPPGFWRCPMSVQGVSPKNPSLLGKAGRLCH